MAWHCFFLVFSLWDFPPLLLLPGQLPTAAAARSEEGSGGGSGGMEEEEEGEAAAATPKSKAPPSPAGFLHRERKSSDSECRSQGHAVLSLSMRLTAVPCSVRRPQEPGTGICCGACEGIGGRIGRNKERIGRLTLIHPQSMCGQPMALRGRFPYWAASGRHEGGARHGSAARPWRIDSV